MLKHSNVAILFGIVMASCAVADDATQAVADATKKICKCSNAKSAAATKTRTTVAAKLTDCKAACADCSKNLSKTNTVTVSTKSADQTAQRAEAVCRTKASEHDSGLAKGIKRLVKALLQGEYQGSAEKNVQWVVTLPGGKTGVPILSNIPYCNGVFKNTGTSTKVVVLQIPRKHVKFMAPQSTADSSAKLAPVVTCSSKECTQKTSDCKSDKVAKNHSVYSTSFGGGKNGECPSKQATPVAIPSPGNFLHPVLPPTHVPPPIAYSPYVAPRAPVASCKCGSNCGCKETHRVADDSKIQRHLTAITAENAKLKAHIETQHEMARQQQKLREQLFEVQLKCVELKAINDQREELIGKIVEATVEKAEMEAHVAVMQERLQLQKEFAAARKEQKNLKGSRDYIEQIANELELSRSENAELKAKIAELEAKVKTISKRVANQRAVQVR